MRIAESSKGTANSILEQGQWHRDFAETPDAEVTALLSAPAVHARTP